MSGLDEPARKRGRTQKLAVLLSQSGGSSGDVREATDDGINIDSELARHLVNEWAWGHISAAEVQRLAQFAHNDEVLLLQRLGFASSSGSKSLKALAGLGNTGRCHQSIHRDLVLYLGEPASPPPLEVPIHTLNMKPSNGDDKVVLHNMPFFLPHVEFAHMFEHCKPFFASYMLGGATDGLHVKEFWATVKKNKDPNLDDHPILKRSSHEKYAIPIYIHGDAVPCIVVGKAG
jgi:hypothetical protein